MKLHDLLETPKPKKIPYDKMSQEEQIAAVTQDFNKLRFIKQQSDAVQIAAIIAADHAKSASAAMTYLINPSEKVQFLIVDKFPVLMGFIKRPTEKAQQRLLDNDPSRFIYVRNPTDKILVQAVKILGGMILYNMITLERFNEQPSKELINIALTDSNFITKTPIKYEQLVKILFKDNTILANKWLRYAENIRGM